MSTFADPPAEPGRNRIASIVRDFAARSSEGVAPPPGFDVASYLDINPDVAAICPPGPDQEKVAIRHFRNHGASEMRRLLRDGQGIDHPDSRLLTDPDMRQYWRAWLRVLTGGTGQTIMDLLRSHPRAIWLQLGFSVLTYLAARPNLAAEVESVEEAAFHFLEFGLEEGIHGRPERWENDFVLARYGVSTEGKTTAIALLSELRGTALATSAHGFCLPLTEVEFWHGFGLAGQACAERFDPDFYHAAATRDGIPPSRTDRLPLIRHFCSHGIRAGLPLGPGLQPEDDFLADPAIQDHNPPVAGTAPLPVRYRWWLKSGLTVGAAPNLAAWARMTYGLSLPPGITTQLKRAALADPTLRPLTMAGRIGHLVAHPLPGLAACDGQATGMPQFLTDVADRLAFGKDSDSALSLYRLALEAMPDFSRARVHLADLLQRQGRLIESRHQRQKLPPDTRGGWNRIASGRIALDLGNPAEAADHLASLPEDGEGDVALKQARDALATQLVNKVWQNHPEHVATEGLLATQKLLRRCLTAFAPPHPWPSPPFRPTRSVAVIAGTDLPQCHLYRAEQKIDQLTAAGLNATLYDTSDDLAAFKTAIGTHDTAIFHRLPAVPPVVAAILTARRSGLMTVYDIDDLVFDTAHFPPPLDDYAGQISAAEHGTMACGAVLFDHAMRLCDIGIASTAALVPFLRERVRTGQVLHHPNALGKKHLSAMNLPSNQPRPKDRVVMLYASGTKAHKSAFHDILEPALARILRRFRNRVELRLIGEFGTFRHLDTSDPAVTLLPPNFDFSAYCALLAEADIALSVLAPTEFTHCKSEIKWLEPALFGIPAVVSATDTMRDVVIDGETGFLCTTSKEFAQTLSRLIRQPDLRDRVGQAARTAVLASRQPDQMGRRLVQGLAGVTTGLPARGRAAEHRTTKIAHPAIQAPKTKPKILLVNVFAPPQRIGGATRVFEDHLRLLRDSSAEKYEVEILCTAPGPTVPELQIGEWNGLRRWAIAVGSDDEMRGHNPRMTTPFTELLRHAAPDLVHFHCIQRLTATIVDETRHAGLPYAITAHDGWWISPNQFLQNPRGQQELYDFSDPINLPPRAQSLQAALTGAQAVLAVSAPFAALYQSCGVPNVITLANGISSFHPLPRLPSSDGRLRLGHFGGDTRHKGAHLLRAALTSCDYRHLSLTLVDNAMAPDNCRTETWGTTPVTRIGRQPQDAMPALFARTDVLLAPSVWEESHGLITREASAAGLWVVASDRGAIGGDIIEAKSGFRISVANYLPLAAVLSEFDRNPAHFAKPPAPPPVLRPVHHQVTELTKLYDTWLSERRTGEDILV
ncbi:glycosyltransferase [Pseudooceanicola aestuarii]|uniref:glycosyltransferase n=1 Tax=Pseudooceanicola aestuarii TaxID=2697319 RepID=UPI0013D11036|nr:glycosyltransferase [Pseudooceanicola aestuarii]